MTDADPEVSLVGECAIFYFEVFSFADCEGRRRRI